MNCNTACDGEVEGGRFSIALLHQIFGKRQGHELVPWQVSPLERGSWLNNDAEQGPGRPVGKRRVGELELVMPGTWVRVSALAPWVIRTIQWGPPLGF